MTGCEKEYLSVNEKMQEHAKSNMSSSTGMNPVLLHMYIQYYRTNLVRIFNKNILALGHLHAEICDRAHDAPTIGQRYVELCSKVCRTDGRRAENSVACVITRVRAGHIAKKAVSASRLGQTVFQDVPDLELFSTCKNTLHGPL